MHRFAQACFVAVVLSFALCAAGTRANDSSEPAFAGTPEQGSVKRYFPPPAAIDGSILDVPDPFGGFNRAVYRFNARFDRAIFLPVLDGYRWIMPDPMEKGVSNFFGNLLEVRNFVNGALQLRGKDSVVTGARFLINTTVGIGGLFDPATSLGLHRRTEDFGQTLGRWGVGAGPYLVLPILGPSGLRDAGGLAFDFALATAADPLQLDGVRDDTAARLAFAGLKGIDKRSVTAFRYYHTGSPFEYVLVRYAYTRMREVEVDR